MKTRILVVDDHQMFRNALSMLIAEKPDLEVVGDAADGLTVIDLARRTRADIVCMDINMPNMDGIETTRRLLSACPGIKVIAVSAHCEQHFIRDMLRAGAFGYVTKGEGAQELLHAISAARQNRKYLCPSASNAIVGAMRHGGDQEGSLIETLGTRERQVFRLVVQGCTSTQIAQQLSIAVTTVNVHRRNIMRKLNLHTVVELTRFAIQNGLVAD